MAEVHESIKPELKKWSVIVLIAIAAFTALVSAYLLKDRFLAKEEVVEEVVEVTDGIGGNLFFTLMPLTEDGVDKKSFMYTSNSNAPSEALTKRSFAKENVSQMSFSPNGEWVTFIAKNQNNQESQSGANDFMTMQVFRSHMTGMSLEDAVNNAEQITNISAALKSLPVINNNGEVLFVSRGSEATDAEISPIPSNWNVYRVGLDGLVTVVAYGLYPHWYDNDKFFFLSDDGIMYHSFEEDTDYLVYYYVADEPGTVDQNILQHTIYTVFDVSNDGSILVVSTSLVGEVNSFHIVADEYGLLALDQIAAMENLPAFWPQISPDNKYVGLLEFEPLKYSIYEINDAGYLRKVGDNIKLDGFDDEDLFITDWR